MYTYKSVREGRREREGGGRHSFHTYFCRDNVDILKSVQKLQRFSVPQFMEKKMKDFVRNVQGKREREGGREGGIEQVRINNDRERNMV